MAKLPDEIAWTLINTEDWGGGDVLLVHLHDEMGAITGAHSRCAKCDDDLTA